MLQNDRKTSDPLTLCVDNISAHERRGAYEVIRARPDIWLCITQSESGEVPRLCLDAVEPVLVLCFGMPGSGEREKGALPGGMIFALPQGRHVLADAPLRGLMLCMTEYRLRAILADDAHALPAKVLSTLTLREYTAQALESVPLFPEQMLAATALMHCPYKGAVRNMFIKSKVLELIALFFLQLTGPGRNGRAMFSSGDQAIVAAARGYFFANMENLPTLRQLARHAGTSETKLQRLFKDIYGVSACAHLRRERMAIARGMLLFQGANVSEAALAVGYNNISHFIDAFTKYYGVRPGEIRSRQHRDTAP